MSPSVESLLLSTPPGLLDKVASNLKVLFVENNNTKNAPLLSDERIADIREVRDSQNGKYVLKQQDVELTHALAISLKAKLTEYLKEKFSATNKTIISMGAQENEILANTYAEYVDEKNSLGSTWFATWKIEADSSASSASVSGCISLVSYSHEDTNVHFKSKKQFPPTSKTAESEEKLIDKIVTQISIWEEEAIQNFHATQDDLRGGLKSLRRLMPVTRTRMDWSVVPHRMVTDLAETSK